jgi:SAM-dependent methyltransferase
MSPDDGFSYDSIAAEYAANVDNAPFNVFYERPAMLSLLPDVRGKRILDAGCGSGWYTEQLLAGGAAVDAIDGSAAMVEHARRRLDSMPAGSIDRVTFRVADLSRPLPFADSIFAGAISPLVLHYIFDWRPALREIHRVLEPGGWFLFSTHHPSADVKLFGTEDYFATERVRDHWDWCGDVEFFRRSLTEMFSSIADAGLRIETLIEPRATREFRERDPKAYKELLQHPAFIVIKATRPI